MSSWMKLEKGVRFDSFDHPIKYAGYTILGPQKVYDIIHAVFQFRGSKTMNDSAAKARKIVDTKYIEGDDFPAWSERTKSNSYHADQGALKHDIGTEGSAKDAKGDWSRHKWQVPQKDHEGRR